MEEVIVGDGHDETVGHFDNAGQKHSGEKVIPQSGTWKLRRVRWHKGPNKKKMLKVCGIRKKHTNIRLEVSKTIRERYEMLGWGCGGA